MSTIGITELRRNLGKYSRLAETEEISVTKRGIVIFRLVPGTKALVSEAKSFLDWLPAGAKVGGIRE